MSNKGKCPRCGGNIYIETDYFVEGSFMTWYEQVTCLQCGFIRALAPSEPEANRRPEVKSLSIIGQAA